MNTAVTVFLITSNLLGQDAPAAAPVPAPVPAPAQQPAAGAQGQNGSDKPRSGADEQSLLTEIGRQEDTLKALATQASTLLDQLDTIGGQLAAIEAQLLPSPETTIDPLEQRRNALTALDTVARSQSLPLARRFQAVEGVSAMARESQNFSQTLRGLSAQLFSNDPNDETATTTANTLIEKLTQLAAQAAILKGKLRSLPNLQARVELVETGANKLKTNLTPATNSLVRNVQSIELHVQSRAFKRLIDSLFAGTPAPAAGSPAKALVDAATTAENESATLSKETTTTLDNVQISIDRQINDIHKLIVGVNSLTAGSTHVDAEAIISKINGGGLPSLAANIAGPLDELRKLETGSDLSKLIELKLSELAKTYIDSPSGLDNTKNVALQTAADSLEKSIKEFAANVTAHKNAAALVVTQLAAVIEESRKVLSVIDMEMEIVVTRENLQKYQDSVSANLRGVAAGLLSLSSYVSTLTIRVADDGAVKIGQKGVIGDFLARIAILNPVAKAIGEMPITFLEQYILEYPEIRRNALATLVDLGSVEATLGRLFDQSRLEIKRATLQSLAASGFKALNKLTEISLNTTIPDDLRIAAARALVEISVKVRDKGDAANIDAVAKSLLLLNAAAATLPANVIEQKIGIEADLGLTNLYGPKTATPAVTTPSAAAPVPAVTPALMP